MRKLAMLNLVLVLSLLLGTAAFAQGEVRTDADGVARWSRTYGGETDDRCWGFLPLADGGFVLLENLRFHPGEEANNEEFAAELAALAELSGVVDFGPQLDQAVGAFMDSAAIMALTTASSMDWTTAR